MREYRNFYAGGDHTWVIVYARTIRGVLSALEKAGLCQADFHTIRPATQEEWRENLEDRYLKLIEYEG